MKPTHDIDDVEQDTAEFIGFFAQVALSVIVVVLGIVLALRWLP